MKLLLLTAILFLPRVVFANVIFSAFTGAYAAPLLFPLAVASALVIEGIVLKILNRRCSIATAAFLVIGSNLISWLCGVGLTSLLPSGLTRDARGIMTSGPDFSRYFIYSFVIAFALSAAIEGAVYFYFRKRCHLTRPWTTSVLGNFLSYAAIWILLEYLK